MPDIAVYKKSAGEKPVHNAVHTLIIRDQDKEDCQGNLPEAEIPDRSQETIELRTACELGELSICQRRGKRDILCSCGHIVIYNLDKNAPLRVKIQPGLILR